MKKHLGQPLLLFKPILSELLLLYLVVSFFAVSAALVREEAEIQWPIYYVSRTLVDAETRYPEMEKLVLALIVASKKLRPYFQAHTIHILTNFPLRKVLQKPEASGRLIQWSLELSQHDVKYLPRTTIKEETLTDFISEFSYQPREEMISAGPSNDEIVASKIAEAELCW